MTDDQIRPVVLLAPHAEALIKKLTSESPDKYKYCEPCEYVLHYSSSGGNFIESLVAV